MGIDRDLHLGAEGKSKLLPSETLCEHTVVSGLLPVYETGFGKAVGATSTRP
jgi:hypothetical protein